MPLGWSQIDPSGGKDVKIERLHGPVGIVMLFIVVIMILVLLLRVTGILRRGLRRI